MRDKGYIRNALDLVNTIIPIPSNLKIIVKKTKVMKLNPYITGLCNAKENIIFLNPDLFYFGDKSDIYKTIYHELGHYVHYTYLDYKPQYIRRKHHGDAKYYCNSNQMESFAECFADYCKAVKKEKFKKIEMDIRLSKMDKIIKNCTQKIENMENKRKYGE